MASPSQTQGSAPATQPMTPPAESSSLPNGVAASAAAPTTQSAAPATSALAAPPAHIQGTSLQDSGKSRRPRDVRLIHMLLASSGVTSYQDRVPLQILDFGYRYSSNILQDSVHFATEGYAGAVGDAAGNTGKNATSAEANGVSLFALRVAIASRLHYQFKAGLSKGFLAEVASEKNRTALPGVSRGFDAAAQNGPNGNSAAGAANRGFMMGGVRMPPERFCFTGTGWDMKDDWESEGEEEEDAMPDAPQQNANAAAGEEAEDREGDEEDEDGRMEDIFGEDTNMGEANEGDGDQKMEDA